MSLNKDSVQQMYAGSVRKLLREQACCILSEGEQISLVDFRQADPHSLIIITWESSLIMWVSHLLCGRVCLRANSP